MLKKIAGSTVEYLCEPGQCTWLFKKIEYILQFQNIVHIKSDHIFNVHGNCHNLCY